MNESKIEWLGHAKNASPMDGQVFTKDEEGSNFTFAWEKTDILSPQLAAFKKDVSDLAAKKLAKSELAFLKANPVAASSELFLRACTPLLDDSVKNVDWLTVQKTIETSVKQFYNADLSKFGPDAIKSLLNDIYFCATAKKSNEKELLGFLLFSVTPALPFGNVKVINFFMREDNTSMALQNTFMGLIFKILPQTNRIFLFARPTESTAIEIYLYGF